MRIHSCNTQYNIQKDTEVDLPLVKVGARNLQEELHKDLLIGMIAIKLPCPDQLDCKHPLPLDGSPFIGRAQRTGLNASSQATQIRIHCKHSYATVSKLIELFSGHANSHNQLSSRTRTSKMSAQVS